MSYKRHIFGCHSVSLPPEDVMSCKYLLLCFVVTLTCFVSDAVGRLAIVGGIKAVNGEFPYQVAIQDLDHRQVCGGGIIGVKFILTAAHCVVKKDNSFNDVHRSIVLGTNDLKTHEKAFVLASVKKIFVPKEYSRAAVNTSADIAVLELNQSLDLLSGVKKLELPKNKHEKYVGQTAMIAGWGFHWMRIENGIPNGGEYDSQLRFAETLVLNTSDCQRAYYSRQITESQMCARVKQREHEQRGVCAGDSGSPLVKDGTVIGILARGPRACDEKIHAGIYTRVTHYLHFIHHAVKGNTHNMRTFEP